ncbi:hypothetical protein [Desulfofundulus sp.]
MIWAWKKLDLLFDSKHARGWYKPKPRKKYRDRCRERYRRRQKQQEGGGQ